MVKLPALPNPPAAGSAEHPLYSANQMQAYGQQCRDAALEEVIALFKEHYTLTTREVIAQIRSLK